MSNRDTSAPTEHPEQIRRDFAQGWGRIGAAWGVAPSTAAVQGYLLAHGGPLTKRELQGALGFSHRATLLALGECRVWGLIEPAPDRRRAGRRGPTAVAWIPVGDHWEWFRRVAAARKERETDPVLPLLGECVARARSTGAGDLAVRLATLLEFVHEFDRGVSAVVGAPASTTEHLFGVLGRVDPDSVSALLQALAAIPEDELGRAVQTLARMRPTLLRRFIGLAGQPALGRLLADRVK